MIGRALGLAAASLWRNPRRTVLTVGALANTVVAGLLFYGFTRHSYWGLAEVFARGGGGHVQVAEADWFDSPSPESHRAPVAQLRAAQRALLADATLGPLVVGSSVRRHLGGMLGDGEQSTIFFGVGTEAEAEAQVAPLMAPVEGVSLAATGQADAVVLGEGLAGRLGVGPGDMVTAMLTTDGGMTNAQDLQVVGLSRSGSVELDRSLATLPLDTALSLADADHADLLVVALRDTADTDVALDATRRVLRDAGLDELDARPWYSRAAYYIAVRSLYDRIFGIFEVLIVAVAALSLTHAVAAVVAERRREIALLRVIGLTRRQVAALFVAEGALLGVIGAVAGLLISWLIAGVVAWMGGIPMPPPPGYTTGYALLFRFDWLGYAIILPATVLAAMMASVFPAWRATSGPLTRTLGGLAVLFAVLAGGPARGEDGAALLASADAAWATPDDQVCTVDLVVHDQQNEVHWRVALAGPRALAVTTSLDSGHRQAVLRDGERVWFQTAGMRHPMRVGASQRLMGQVAVADLLAPHLQEAWRPLGFTDDGALQVEAVPGGPAAQARAELRFDADGRLISGRFFGRSGRALRAATWRWEGPALLGVTVTDEARGGHQTTVDTTRPACVVGDLGVSEGDLMGPAQALAEQP